MALPDGGAAVFATATRICPLDENGNPDAGVSTYVTNTLIEATFAPTNATGDDIEVKNAAGDLAVYTRHGDMPKYYAVSLELAIPDPNLEAVLCGGTVYGSSSAALGATSAPTLGTLTTGGSLAAGTYGYRVADYNQYGETAATTEVTQVTTGATSQVIVTCTPNSGGLGCRVYGRVPGNEQFLGVVPYIGTPKNGAALKPGAITSIPLEAALTVPVPAGTTLVFTGDTAKLVFTTNAAAGVGALALSVNSVTVVTEIATKSTAVPVYVDKGTQNPEGLFNSSDTTAGSLNVGYQAPALGGVPNPNGVSLEFYEKAIVGGTQATYLPFWRIVLPGCKNFVVESRSVKNANLPNKFSGQAFQNINWGKGPANDWQFDSSKVVQRARCSRQVVPTPGFANAVEAIN